MDFYFLYLLIYNGFFTRNQKASTKTTLNLEKRASDSELYKDLNTEYNKLRDEITKMSIDPEIEPEIENSQ